MAGQPDDDRPGREPLRALITACGVLLACAALAALVFTDDPKHLRVALVAALWAFLLVSITGRFRPHNLQTASSESDEELRRFYQMELQQEVAARREYELRLEVQLRRELEESRTREIEELRAEVHRLRAELMGIEAPDRAALMASARLTPPDQRRPLKDDTQQRPPARAERLQLPAGFSDSPPSGSSSPSHASTVHPSQPSTSTFATAAHSTDRSAQSSAAADTSGSEAFIPTEFIPAGSHKAQASSESSSYRRPESYRGVPATPSVSAPTSSYPVEAHHAQEATESPASATGAESAGAHRMPSHSWASYASPTTSQEIARASLAGSTSTTSSGTGSGYSVVGGSGSHPVIEPYDNGTRGVPAARPDPFDPSNTWRGAFTPRSGSQATASGQPESYPPKPAEWRPVEQTTSSPSRGRHHAADDDEDEDAPATTSETATPQSRPDDDVLAQILGRW